jgi:TRAP-type C4-dicarboxylate transport system permease small subunit
MLACNVLFLMGTWQMHELQVSNVSPVVGISMIWVYGIGYVVSVVMSIINLSMLYKLLTGQLREEDLVAVIESEDTVDLSIEKPQGSRA